MKIKGIIWTRDVVDKILFKHGVRPEEVEEVLQRHSKIRRLERGRRKGEDVYVALGRSEEGRYLAVLFIYKKTSKQYERK